jgi:hypothetical protein
MGPSSSITVRDYILKKPCTVKRFAPIAGKAIPKQCVALLKVYTGQEKIIFLGAQPGDKNFLQTPTEYFCAQSACA